MNIRPLDATYAAELLQRQNLLQLESHEVLTELDLIPLLIETNDTHRKVTYHVYTDQHSGWNKKIFYSKCIRAKNQAHDSRHRSRHPAHSRRGAWTLYVASATLRSKPCQRLPR